VRPSVFDGLTADSPHIPTQPWIGSNAVAFKEETGVRTTEATEAAATTEASETANIAKSAAPTKTTRTSWDGVLLEGLTDRQSYNGRLRL